MSKTCPLNILLVDDNPVNISVGSRILELFGYKNIATACDGLQAVEAAERDPYDIILCDLSMPICSGFEAQQRIKASPLAGDPCIVALTANADQVSAKMCGGRIMPNLTDCKGNPKSMPRGWVLFLSFEAPQRHQTTGYLGGGL